MDRRGFLKRSALGGVAFLTAGMALQAEARAAPAAVQSGTRPNILLILTDDQPAHTYNRDVMPKTMALLGDRGLTFRRAYCTVPQCAPDRATILSGKYSHNHGIVGNKGAFDKFEQQGYVPNSIAARLRDVGYSTGIFGKVMNGYDGTSVWQRAFDRWVVFNDLRQEDPDSYVVNEDGEIRRLDRSVDNETDWMAGKCESFIRDHADRRWFALFSPHSPHGPYYPARRHEHDFDGVPLPRPPSYDEADVSDKPADIQALPRISDTARRSLRRTYEGKLEELGEVDDAVERFSDLLDSLKLWQNTLVFFVTDNGFLLGEHRLQEKKAEPYEESSRTPYVVRGAGVVSGAVSDALVGTVDLPATFAALAGADTSGLDGRDLQDVLGGTIPPEWRKRLLVSHPGKGWQMLREGDYAYVEHDTGEQELYHLESDPHELQSLHASPEHQALIDELHARLKALKTCAGNSCRTAEGP